MGAAYQVESTAWVRCFASNIPHGCGIYGGDMGHGCGWSCRYTARVRHVEGLGSGVWGLGL